MSCQTIYLTGHVFNPRDIILHFSHGHHLRFETSGVYDESKFCQACALPTDEEKFYVCVECNFILHETCANAPCKKFHPLHHFPLELMAVHKKGGFFCDACGRMCNGFVYFSIEQKFKYTLDIRYVLISEPFTYQGHHQHPLFLALDPKEKPMCHVCKSVGGQKVLNCIECDFVICFNCATIPYMVRYKHDEHYLAFCHGDEASDSDWCELCEGKLAIGGKEQGFYKCDDCCTTLHIDCLLGIDPYLTSGQSLMLDDDDSGVQMHFIRNNSPSRPLCTFCNSRCPYPVFLKVGEELLCSLECFKGSIMLFQCLSETARGTD